MESDTASRPDRAHRHRAPALVALGVALFGITTMALVDHGPWNKPKVQTAHVQTYTNTGEAARAAGATVTDTAPRSQIEPVAPGPKPVAPAQPDQTN